MRDSQRMKRILKKLQQLWEQNPDLRLSQLCIWVGVTAQKKQNLPINNDIFYIEDATFEEALDQLLKKDDKPCCEGYAKNHKSE